MAVLDRPRTRPRLARSAAVLASGACALAVALTIAVAGPVAANTVIDTIEVGANPTAVAVSGDRAYVTDYLTNSVSVIAIDQAPALSGTPAPGTLDQPYRYAFIVTGRPAPTVAVTAGALPDGLAISPDGVLSGTFTVDGRFEFTLTATNGIGRSAVLPVALNITPPATGSLGSLGSS